ncbi:hypothetical protein, partial [Lacticaseibacillus paracasei]|uniref:hypothetical protein n=1 Tax=Lacticaseibacillus paracasei TaxID=1597 RepID=UPI00051581DC
HFGQIRLTLIIRLTIGKAYYESAFRVFHHQLNTKNTLMIFLPTGNSFHQGVFRKLLIFSG